MLNIRRDITKYYIIQRNYEIDQLYGIAIKKRQYLIVISHN